MVIGARRGQRQLPCHIHSRRQLCSFPAILVRQLLVQDTKVYYSMRFFRLKQVQSKILLLLNNKSMVNRPRDFKGSTTRPHVPFSAPSGTHTVSLSSWPSKVLTEKNLAIWATKCLVMSSPMFWLRFRDAVLSRIFKLGCENRDREVMKWRFYQSTKMVSLSPGGGKEFPS